MLEIIRNVEMPKRLRKSSPKARKYPFDEMAPGDMFFVENAVKNTLSSLALQAGKRLGCTFSTRMTYMAKTDFGWVPCTSIDDGAVLGIGVWRDK